jgi:DNA (cytosine-5)-methyltransferase 1
VTAPTARPAAPPSGRPTFGSLFAGIGGLDLGLERVGWECRWQVEIDDYCRRVLAKHWSEVPRFGDIRTVTGGELERVDLICGGFPCQDISGAGKRIGIGGARSGLWSEYIRLVRVVRPRLVLVENVAALLDRGMGRVLGDLAESGYDAEWQCLSASRFGAPHERERVFLIAYPGGEPGRRRIFPDRLDDLPRNPEWDSTQGLKSGRGWKRWLIAACAPVDGSRSDAWFRRVDDGAPGEVDRLRGLGNAVVPQVAEWIGRRLLETMA